MEQMEDLSSNHSFSESKEYNSEKTHSLHEQEPEARVSFQNQSASVFGNQFKLQVANPSEKKDYNRQNSKNTTAFQKNALKGMTPTAEDDQTIARE
jgi:hypothetical protein